MTDRETWLSTIRSNPSDWQAMLVFADWLEEEGDSLAAEQWRWIACVSFPVRRKFTFCWPLNNKWTLLPDEMQFAFSHRIRAMPTYPLTIEDVQAYLERV